MLAFGLVFWMTGRNELPRRDFDWIVAYYMSYDNVLSPFGSTVINELYKGLDNDRVLVSVLADFEGEYGLRRIQMTDGYYHEDIIATTDNSADPAVLRDYLQWLTGEFSAKKYVIVFLNCGGRVNQMNLDCNSGDIPAAVGDSEAWLDPEDVGGILSGLHNDEIDIELLFFQQVGRGSIENLYCFKDSADFLMASTLGVGAPNAYYKKTIKKLCALPAETTSGAEVADLIMRYEKDDQFHNYICYDAAAFPELIARMREYALLWPEEYENEIGPGFVAEPDLVTFGERIYDIVKILDGDPRPQAGNVVDCILNKFVVSSRVSSQVNCECGPPALLTTLVPDNKDLREEYQDHPAYVETGWNRFTFSLLKE